MATLAQVAYNPVPRAKDGRPPVISSSYRSSDRPDHNGVDIMYRRPAPGAAKLPHYSKNFEMPWGVPCFAYMAGTVTTAKLIGTGGYVVIDHAGEWQSQYMHLQAIDVKVGQKVAAGQRIGEVGADPNYPLIHLHFQLRYNGGLVNPKPYIDAAIIKPWPGLLGSPVLYMALAGMVVGGYWWWTRRRRR